MVQSIHDLLALRPLLTLFVIVLAKQAGAPLPAAPVLMLAGATAAHDAWFGTQALLLAIVASTIGDSGWFLAGRLAGRKILALLCRISVTPDTCVRRNEMSFSRRGPAVLVIAKFVPGLDTLAPAMAGSIGMSARRFLLLDAAGAALWAGSGMAAGLVLHRQIQHVERRLADLGAPAAWLVAGLVIAYVAWRFWRRWRESVAHAAVPRILPHELADMIHRGDAPLVLDIRAGASSSPTRIAGARAVDLAALEQAALGIWPERTEVITYCDCPNEVTASRAAHLLASRGFAARVLQGGLGAWLAGGYAVDTNASAEHVSQPA
jgi:membrane protein DedA with SNARE-associated domain/rhodanese-related sulfurtransferase